MISLHFKPVASKAVFFHESRNDTGAIMYTFIPSNVSIKAFAQTQAMSVLPTLVNRVWIEKLQRIFKEKEKLMVKKSK